MAKKSMIEREKKRSKLVAKYAKKRQQIKGSKVTLAPGTVFLEMSMVNGNYITGSGKIDSNARPKGVN